MKASNLIKLRELTASIEGRMSRPMTDRMVDVELDLADLAYQLELKGEYFSMPCPEYLTDDELTIVESMF